MNTGTSAAKEAGNMVDLDSDPTKLIEDRRDRQAVADHPRRTHHVLDRQRHRQVLRHHPGDVRRAPLPGLTCSISCVCTARSRQSCPAVIFNAIVIIALIPLSLRGVRYTPSSASKLLSRNLYVYGLGGIVAPFIGIKLIDLVIQFLPGMALNLSTLIRQHWAALRAAGAHRHRGHRISLLIWLVAQIPGLKDKADGSIIELNGKPVASSLIGQLFTDDKGNPLPQYFQSRLSAAGADYDT